MPVQNTETADNNLGLEARTVAGMFRRQEDAEAAVDRLQALGWTNDAIGVVYKSASDEGTARHRAAEDTKTGEAAATGAALGGALGGAAGLLAGLAAIAVPGLGLLAAAGPVATALGGALLGGAMGGLAGSFAGLGIPDEHAKAYEAAVREGGIFVSVRAKDEADAERAEGILKSLGAGSINTYQTQL